jgi:Papain family cysteine protease
MAAYLVAHGPLAIAADAAEWQFYIGGNFFPSLSSSFHSLLFISFCLVYKIIIINNTLGVFDIYCGKTLDHGILIVGYGNETTIFGHHVDYWTVKNSWYVFLPSLSLLPSLRPSLSSSFPLFVLPSLSSPSLFCPFLSSLFFPFVRPLFVLCSSLSSSFVLPSLRPLLFVLCYSSFVIRPLLFVLCYSSFQSYNFILF